MGAGEWRKAAAALSRAYPDRYGRQRHTKRGAPGAFTDPDEHDPDEQELDERGFDDMDDDELNARIIELLPRNRPEPGGEG